MGLNKVKRGAGLPSSGGGAMMRLPLPLALACCFAFFFAGSLFGGKSFSNLPDTKPRKTVSAAATVSTSGQQQQGVEASAGVSTGAGLASHGVGEHLAGSTGVQQQSRRQLAAHQGDAEAVLSGDGEVVDESRHAPDTIQLPLPQPYPHGATGKDFVETVAMQMLSWKPRAYIFPGFAPTEKCDDIVALAKKFMHPSGLALRPGETSEGTRDIRTSSGAFLASTQDPSGALAWVEEKMARVTMISPQHGEAYNVLRYEQGQHYDSHMDVFDPKEYGPQGSNRVASFLLYLSDVEEGGETMFPYEGGKNMHIGYNYKDCLGLKVKPRKGDALLFWSMFPDGKIDPHALHGSCPVIKGEKWVATKWIRDHSLHW